MVVPADPCGAAGGTYARSLKPRRRPRQLEKSSRRPPKFFELAKIIHGLGETERVLVVSPLKSMLDDVREEMAKLRVPLAILRGGAVEQQNTLKAWQTGGLQGFVIRPGPACTELERG